MSAADLVMRSVLDDVDGALGCAVVDLRDGTLVGVAHNVPYFTDDYLHAVGRAAVAMFRGDTVTHVEQLIADQRRTPHEHLIEEVQMTTLRTLHFMMTLPNHRQAAVVLITDRRSNVGMGWAAIRRSVLAIEPILDEQGFSAGEPADGPPPTRGCPVTGHTLADLPDADGRE